MKSIKVKVYPIVILYVEIIYTNIYFYIFLENYVTVKHIEIFIFILAHYLSDIYLHV